MRLYEIAGVGRITKQNQTPDVGPDAIQKQAAKFGNRVDRDGKPPLLHSRAYKNTTPNKSWNLGLSENYTPLEIAILEGGHSLEDQRPSMRYSEFDEDFTGDPKPGSRPGSLKRKAAQYLGKGAGEKLTKSDLRKLQAKANKMKKSEKKAERQRGIQLARQISWARNFNVTD
jgi:hypothetical protein